MPTGSRPFVRPPTAQEAVLAELRRSIVRGELRPGATLLQEEIGESLGLSRVPVREALHILEGEGLLTRVPKKAYQVTSLDEAELNDLFRLRELLESMSVSRTWASPDRNLAAALTPLVADMENAMARGDVEQFTSASRTFHFAVFGGAENSRLRKLIGQLWSTAEPYSVGSYDSEAARARLVRDAKRIARALRSGDRDLALRLLAEHRRRLAAHAKQTQAQLTAARQIEEIAP